MKLRSLLGLFRGRPHHPVGPDGRMALSDHFREFRARLMRSVLVLFVAFIAAIFFRHVLYDAVYDPYMQAQAQLPKDSTEATTSGPGAGLTMWLTLCGFGALVVTAPYWLYQIWAFIVPGLYARERKMSRVFAAIAGPLFIVGVALGYVTLPLGLEVLIGFNPEGITNLVDFNDYLQFFTRTLFVFGLAFNIPVFVVLLNAAGIVKGKALAAYRPWIVIGTFLFAAIATPSADPFTMTLMAVPMLILFLMSEVIARVNDRRRASRSPNTGLSPDELSPI